MTLHKAPVIVISHLILQNLLALSCFSYTCFPTIFLGHSKTRNRNHNRWGHQKFVHGTTTIGKSNHQVVASLQDEATSLFNKIANQEENISSEKDKNKQEDEFSFHLSSTESIMEELDISRSINEHIQLGLTNEEASKRLEIYGMNLIPSPPRKTWTGLFLDQFDDRLVQILLFVAGLSTFSSISEIISSSMGNIARDSEINIFQSLVEPGIILLILVLNAAVGVWQQLSAFDSMDALEKLQPYLATVLRRAGNAQYSTSNTVKGEWVSGYSASELVPGDIVKMKTGDMVPADVKIIILNSSVFSVNESYLTGESVAVQKVIDFGDVKTQMQHEAKVPISEQRDMAFSGTMVTQGSAIALVVRTGGKTEMGKIQGSIISVEDIKTPLGIKLDDFGDDLALIIAFICAAVWFVSIPNFSDPSFSTSYDGALYYAKVGVALGVAAIPEGLPAVVTLVLSLGTRRLAERNVIVRKLPSVETLGCVSVICSDKTGTLTTNQMTAVRIVTLDDSTGKGLEFVENSVNGTSYKPVGKVDGIDNDEIIRFPTGALADILSISFGCNDAELIEKDGDYIVVGEPTEGALICLAEKLGEINYENRPYTVDAANKKVWEKSWERYATLEFDRERKSMSVLCREARDSLEQNSIPNEVTHRLLVKGAPNLLLERCSRIKLRDGKTMDLTPDLKEELRLTISSLSQRPLRCLLLAVKEISGGLTEEVPLHNLLHDPTNFEEIESDLTVVGIVGIKDPARLDAKKSIEMCKDAGIRVIMISGDAKETTTAIAQELNILSEDEVNCTFTGREFFSKSESEQTSLISSGNIVFCRTEPLDKQQIVKILQSMDEIPAMTGDGVNDAPALRQASIGVAMGSGSDVAKEAADMILVDDSFSTIVDGVEEGRGIYANIQAFINFLISCNVGEVLAVFFASFMGFPSILSAMQLLWVNLVTDGPAAVALGFNPIDKDVMKERPRDVNEAIMTPWLMTRYLLLGSYVGFATVGVFAFHYISEGVSLNQLSHWSACSTTSDFDLCNSLFGPDALVIPQTLALSTLVTIELLKAISTVSVDGSLFKISPLSNPYLILGVTIPFAFHLMILYTPISTSFGLSPLSIEQWTTVLLWSLPVIFIDEFLKAVGRKIKS